MQFRCWIVIKQSAILFFGGPTSTPKLPFKLVIISFDKGAAESCETIILSPFKLIQGTCYTASSYRDHTIINLELCLWSPGHYKTISALLLTQILVYTNCNFTTTFVVLKGFLAWPHQKLQKCLSPHPIL